MAPRSSACRSASGLSQPATMESGKCWRTARAKDPPMSPVPTIATRRKGPVMAQTSFSSDGPVDRRSDDAQFGHELVELIEEEGLCAVGKRVLGIVVHLEQQSIGPRGDGGARHGR